MFTVPTATTDPTGASTGSLQVKAVSPLRAAAFLLMKTVLLPLMMVALLAGGLTNVPPIGTCGGVFVAVLCTVAAAIFAMFTFELSPPSMIPEKGCGVRTGGAVPGGWIRCMSVAVTLSPCFAAG